MTNADRIRAMTDEELLDLIMEGPICPAGNCPDTNCEECRLIWLKKEVSDGETGN